MGEYKVEENGCLCHPETCICNPRKITKDGKDFITIFEKKKALIIVNSLNNYEALEAENERLNKMRVHCEHCGGDYMATGIEVGCPCRLQAKLARLVSVGKTITTWLDECPPVDLIKGIDLWAKELKAAIEVAKDRIDPCKQL